MPPKVFGYVSFIYKLGTSQDKLSPRVVKCIFLSYSGAQKGYMCWSLDSGWLFVSIGVSFKNMLFFDDSHYVPEVEEALPLLVVVEFIMFIPRKVSRQEESIHSPLVHVYKCWKDHSSLEEVVFNSPSVVLTFVGPVTSNLSDLYIFIALRKGKWTSTSHRISHFVSHDHISPTYYAFITLQMSMRHWVTRIDKQLWKKKC